MRHRRSAFTAVAALLIVGSTRAAFAQSTWVVDDDGQGSAANCDDAAAAFSTVTTAIAPAANGDTVLVCPGIFVETVNFGGKAIVVRSKDGPATTILDGNQADSVVTFTSGEGPSSTLEGFTVRNGRSGFDTPGFGDGGGIRIASASPTIRGNAIVSNQACVGIGISVRFGSPVIESNRIADNVQTGCSGGTGGGGIGLVGASNAQIRDNVIENNLLTGAHGGGISLFAAGAPLIERNVIADNSVGGIIPCAQGGGIVMFNQSDPKIVGNLIIRNHAGCGGGVYWLIPPGSQPLLVSNTIADNDSPQGSGVFADGFDQSALLVNNIIVAPAGQTAVFCGDFNDVNPPQFFFNDVFASAGVAYGGLCPDQTGTNGNVSTDPLFVNAAAGDYHLTATSPLIDAGDNAAPELPPVDLEGDPRVHDGDGDGTAVVDVGADEVFSTGPVSVSIDVKPGSRRNRVNPRSHALLRVAVFSTATFDATTIDPATVRFGPALARAVRARRVDVNRDGNIDLLLGFRTNRAGFTCASTSAVLAGETFTGQLVQGTDVIEPFGCKPHRDERLDDR